MTAFRRIFNFFMGIWNFIKKMFSGEKTERRVSVKRESNKNTFGFGSLTKRKKDANGQSVPVHGTADHQNEDFDAKISHTKQENVKKSKHSGQPDRSLKKPVAAPRENVYENQKNRSTDKRETKKKRRAPSIPKTKKTSIERRKKPENGQNSPESAHIISMDKKGDTFVQYTKENAHKGTEKNETKQHEELTTNAIGKTVAEPTKNPPVETLERVEEKKISGNELVPTRAVEEPVIHEKNSGNELVSIRLVEEVIIKETISGKELVPIRAAEEASSKIDKHYEKILEKIEDILKRSKDFEEKIDGFMGFEQDPEFYYIDENLQRNIDKLDRIDVKGSVLLREKRKEAIKYIYRAVERLEDKAKENEEKAKQIQEKTNYNEAREHHKQEIVNEKQEARGTEEIVNKNEEKRKLEELSYLIA